MSRRRDINLLERSATCYFAVGNRILGYPAGDADPIEARQFMQSSEDVEDDRFCVPLHGGRDVHVVLRQFVAFLSRGAKQFDEAWPEQRCHRRQVIRVRYYAVFEVVRNTWPFEQAALFQR